MIENLIFRPNLTGTADLDHPMPLDVRTRHGLFSGQSGNRYIVCDDPYHRFAVALEHTEMEPFTGFRLGDLPSDIGRLCELDGINLGEQIFEPIESDVPGMLEVDDGTIRLYIRSLSGTSYWTPIAVGVCNVPRGIFCDWTMTMCEIPFFGISSR